MYHKPVLLEESVAGLSLIPGGTYVDATFGGGGHSGKILSNGTVGCVIAFDQDEEANANTIRDKRFHLINRNFRYLIHYLRYFNAIPVDGILADLGISSHQIDSPERGFSIRSEGPLDLRMDRKQSLSAKVVVNTYAEEKLTDIFRMYGELDKPAKIARTIVQARNIRPIETTTELIESISRHAPRGRENQFYARVFQALRIEVNHELEALSEFLEQAEKVLRPGGRLAIISYHSLEDRLVKNFMKTGNVEGKPEKDFYGRHHRPFEPVTRKPLTPSENELRDNARSRSAKLRIAEKR